MDFSTNDTHSIDSSSDPDHNLSPDQLRSQNMHLRQQLADLKDLYREMHDMGMNHHVTRGRGGNGQSHSMEQLLYKELRYEKARRLQVERLCKRLQKAAHLRREAFAELEHFALEVKAMSEDSNADDVSNNVAYLKKWVASFMQRIRSFHIHTEKAERQGLFLPPGSAYLDEQQLGLDGLNLMDVQQGKMQDVPYLNTHNLAMLEDKLNDLFRYTCKLANTVKYSFIPHLHDAEEKLVQENTFADAQLLLKQIDEVRREVTQLGAVVPSKFDNDFGLSKGSNDSSNEDPLSYMSLNTKELVKKLPKFSRHPSECEASLRALVKCFNTQKHVWKLEKDMLKEEVTFHDKVANFFRKYTVQMLKQLDFTQKKMIPTPEKPTPSSSYSGCIQELHHRFLDFDQDANQENLHELLVCFKSNAEQIQHVIAHLSEESALETRDLQSDLAKLSREVDVLEMEHKQKMDSILGRKYELEEDLMQREMFMRFKPHMVPLGEEKPNDAYRLRSAGGSDHFHPNDPASAGATDQRKGPQRSGSTRSLRSDTTDDRMSRVNKKTRPPVSRQEKKSNSNLPPNVVELQEIVDETRNKMEEMTHRLSTEKMTDMQKYALKKQIARTKASLKKNERTLNSMTK